MALWFKALPLTASCLSPLSEFESHPPGPCEKLPSDMGIDGVFRHVILFSPPITTCKAQLSRNMAKE